MSPLVNTLAGCRWKYATVFLMFHHHMLLIKLRGLNSHYNLLHHLFLDLWSTWMFDVWVHNCSETQRSICTTFREGVWTCAHYIWRELCMYLCNHVIQRSRSHVTMFKIRWWEEGEGQWGHPSIYTKSHCEEKPVSMTDPCWWFTEGKPL